MTRPSPSAPLRRLDGGRSLQVAPDALQILDPDGALELEIAISDAGLEIRARARSLHLDAAQTVALDCRRFRVRAIDGIEWITDGDLSASVAGDLDLRAGGHARLDGRAARVRATRGPIELDAHDDVRVDGERILLNS